MIHRRHPLSAAVLLVALFTAAASAPAHAAPIIKAEVNLTDLSRRLIEARLEIPCKPGKLTLWYPKWIPGVHAPAGPIQNIAGLRFETPAGKPIAWIRDDVELYQFHLDIPAGVSTVVAKLTYIANQPSVNSSGVDTFGNVALGAVNFNTCLLYPDGADSEQLQVALTVKLPAGWKAGCALPVERQDEAAIAYKPRPLVEVIDSPLITGEHFRTIDLSVEKWPPVYLHVTSESPSAIQLSEKRIEQYKALVREAQAMFGAAHFPEYHFLLICSDDVPRIGLEHHASSLNAVGERDIVDDKRFKDWAAYLLPHEFVHSWCGKFRRPAAMMRNDYHSPQRTGLLWVYEGLTQYLGEVLAVRAGMFTMDEQREKLARKISSLARQDGRRWRALVDTAVASHLLRGASKSWHHMRRGQDYYNEGLLVWMEADAIIRQLTDGRKSLDDFCRAFFGHPGEKQRVLGYELDDVLAALNEVASHDWKSLLARRVDQPADALDLDFVSRVGYRLQYDSATPAMLEDAEKLDGSLDATDSLGLKFAKDGKIAAVVPGMTGDKARLGPDVQVMGVNGLKFSRQRIKDAIADSTVTRGIKLLILDGEKYREVSLDYADGLRYMTLTRDPAKNDLLTAIFKPTTKVAAK